MKYFLSIFTLLAIGFFAGLPTFGKLEVFSDLSTPKVQAESQKNQPIFYFLRDLREGDTGEDVRQLQKILNMGEMDETGVFDRKTAQFVVEFQNKYANEVLRPVGLTRGTGFVGLWTRLKLNQLLLKPLAPVASPVASTTQPSASSTVSTAPKPTSDPDQKYFLITFATAYYGPVGTSVTLSGYGFSTKSNTVHMVGKMGKKYKIENVVAKSDSEITFTIPKNVPVGRYDIAISNSSFKKPSNGTFFMVTVPGAAIPVIEKIETVGAKKTNSLSDLLFAKEPTIKFGQTIKITGKNFTPKGNIISSNVGVFYDLPSSDGKTITFTIPLPDYLARDRSEVEKAWFKGKDNLYWSVQFIVANVNGLSAHTESAKCIINI